MVRQVPPSQAFPKVRAGLQAGKIGGREIWDFGTFERTPTRLKNAAEKAG